MTTLNVFLFAATAFESFTSLLCLWFFLFWFCLIFLIKKIGGAIGDGGAVRSIAGNTAKDRIAHSLNKFFQR